MPGVSLIVDGEFYETWAAEDTDHARSFRTYLNYLKALRLFIEDAYGTAPGSYAGLAAVMMGQVSCQRMKFRACKRQAIEKALRNAWATETVILQSAASGSPEVIACANLWATVQSYYAIYHAVLAFFEASGWATTNTHTGTLKQLSYIATTKQYFPAPWNSWCNGSPKALTYGGLAATASTYVPNSLSVPSSEVCPEWIAMLLRTTRERKIEEAKIEWLKHNRKQDKEKSRYKLVPARYQGSVIKSVDPTTLFDFLYRFRVRSNYRDADAFVLSSGAAREALEFNSALTTMLQSTLFVLEFGIARCLGRVAMGDIAASFQSAVGSVATRGIGTRIAHL